MTELAWATIETPIGQLLLVASGAGLVRVGLPVEPPDELVELMERRYDGFARRDPEALADAGGQLDEYFAGTRQTFTMPLDLSRATGFRLRVLEEMLRIPYGQTVSYGELATRAGSPTASRAAGQACATNPLPIVVPCHRVLRSDGGLNWYTGGLHFKEFLLRHEGAILA